MHHTIESKSLRRQIFSINSIVIVVTILLTLAGTFYVALNQNRKTLDQNLVASAEVIARMPLLIEHLESGELDDRLWTFLDDSMTETGDINRIIVADMEGAQYYHPEKTRIGTQYKSDQYKRLLIEHKAFVTDASQEMEVERSAYAPVLSQNGDLIGFVMVGVDLNRVTQVVLHYFLSFCVVAVIALLLGGFLSFQLSDRIKSLMLGYEPEVLVGLFHQREDILEALEEAVLAIDSRSHIMYSNRAMEQMMGIQRDKLLGKHLHDIFPESTLDRLLTLKRSEYNIPFTLANNERILAHHMPILEYGTVIGAVAILRNRTEVTRLAKDLTGVRHIVEAMRAYTHEFMNKLHVIWGLLHLGEAEKAEEYIMNVTSIQQKAVGAIMTSIEDPSVAALLLGKMSRCGELGIQLTLAEGSVLKASENIIPTDACVTILGNLIQNAFEALNRSVPSAKEIIVTIKESDEDLLICVEDTGPGIATDLIDRIFDKGFSTKSATRGTGLTLVHSVVMAYQGNIRVESEIGHGTTFWVRFLKRAEKEGELFV